VAAPHTDSWQTAGLSNPSVGYQCEVTGTSKPVRRQETSVTNDSGPENAARGVVEDVKGKAKEVIGEITGNESKEREGRAQQDKARSEREVAEHEAKAEAARSEASMHEAEQRVHQNHDD
jgi:uncharacterized protein YjbJ (UPF0337 family)